MQYMNLLHCLLYACLVCCCCIYVPLHIEILERVGQIMQNVVRSQGKNNCCGIYPFLKIMTTASPHLTRIKPMSDHIRRVFATPVLESDYFKWRPLLLAKRKNYHRRRGWLLKNIFKLVSG